jgi:signal transduction histidine kinase/phage shock protein PspC (stress-responsive transcriptional regulator)
VNAPKLYRRVPGRLLAGVATGIAEHLGVPVLAVRIVLVLSVVGSGFGVVVYAVFWAMLDIDPRDKAAGAVPRWDFGKLVGFLAVALVVGVALAIARVQGPYVLVWCLGVIAVGAVVIWRRAGEDQRQRWTELNPRYPWLGLMFAGDRTINAARLTAGGLLVLSGLVGFFAATGELGAVRDGLFFGTALLVGVGVVVAPWIWRIVVDLRDERFERIRSQERAEIAAIVHDQVLHTLALIQRNADDSREVSRLARSQERQLRNWLYKPSASPTERLAAALEAVVAEVEDTYAISVDSVVVGDCDTDERLNALVLAAREAMVNAGRHAGVPTVSLYAEVEPEQISVFVRDRGTGFDPSTVDGDRHGVRGSILGRMARHGGEAAIRSAPGDGTEIRLTMPRPARAGGTA